MKTDRKDEYLAFQSKLIRRACINAVTSAAVVVGLYLFVWKQRMGDWIVWLLETLFKMGHEDAFYYYSDHFRGNKEIFFAAAVLLIFTVLLVRIFRARSTKALRRCWQTTKTKSNCRRKCCPSSGS